jgi:hypothetical protein
MNDSQYYLMMHYYKYKEELSEKKKIRYANMQQETIKNMDKPTISPLTKKQVTWYSSFSPNNKILQPNHRNNNIDN